MKFFKYLILISLLNHNVTFPVSYKNKVALNFFTKIAAVSCLYLLGQDIPKKYSEPYKFKIMSGLFLAYALLEAYNLRFIPLSEPDSRLNNQSDSDNEQDDDSSYSQYNNTMNITNHIYTRSGYEEGYQTGIAQGRSEGFLFGFFNGYTTRHNQQIM